MQPEHTRSVKFLCRMDASALAGVLIALLYMFMADTTTTVHGRSMPVELAQASHSAPMYGADREDALLIAITRDGKIFFGKEKIGSADLAGKIEERLKHAAERKAYIKADARTRYHSVVDVLNGVRDAGVEQVGLLTAQSR